MTVTMLLENTIASAERSLAHENDDLTAAALGA